MTAPRTVLITGATAGLGRYLAGAVAGAGWRVLLHGRDASLAARVREELLAAHGDAEVEVVLADLASLREVDALATSVRRFERLDVLVNNAGVGFGPPGSARELSRDGIELRFAVNYLAGYRLTRELLPLLRASAPARVVNVASVGQYPIDFADPMLETGYDGIRAYRQSKLAQIMFTIDLADELRGQGVTVNAVHPASLMDTAMVRESGFPTATSVEQGGAATMRLIVDPDLDGVSGRYFDGTSESRAVDQAYDAAARSQLRKLSADLIAEALE